MNVRFFAGSKAQYLALAKHNPIALYFCHDTRELFWGDRLLSDGIRIVETEANLPSAPEAADGIIYHVAESGDGYALSPDRTKWIRVISGSNQSSGIKAISFAGTKMEEVGGVFTIDRKCAREALGFIVPDGLDDEEIHVATEDFVRDEIAKIELGEVEIDLENYYNKEQTDGAIAAAIAGIEIPNVSELATKSELQEAIGSIEHPSTDLSAYYTAEQIDEQLQSYVTNNTYEINQTIVNNALDNRYNKTDADKRFALKANLNELSEKVDAIKVVTKVSELANDVGYITEIPVEYVTESELEAKGYLTEHQSLEEYAKLTDLPSVSGLATESFVLNKIAEAELNDKDVDLTGYATKDDIAGLATTAYVNEKVAGIKIPNVDDFITMEAVEAKGYLTSIPEDYAKKEDLFSGDYNDLINVPNIPSTEGLATEQFVTEAIADIALPVVPENVSAFKNDAGYLVEHQDISHLAEKDHTHEQYLTEHQDLSEYAKLTDIPTNYLTAIPDEYVTESELAEELAKIEHPAVDLEGYATEQYVDDKIATIDFPEPDLSGYAKLIDIPDVSKFITGVPAEYITEDELTAKGYITEHQSLEGYATESYVTEQIESIDLSDYAKAEDIPTDYLVEADLDGYSKFSGSYNDLTDKPEIPSTEGLATEEFVAEAISEIELPEADLSAYSTTEEMSVAIANAVAEKADNIPFTAARIVGKAIGGFSVGDNLNGMTLVEILAKLLELSEETDNPDEPAVPDEPNGVVETIIAYKKPMYAVNADGELAEVPYSYMLMTEAEAAAAATKPGFYQIKDADGNIIESGYQELQLDGDGSVYYVIALPKEVDYETMVTVQAYDTRKNIWAAAEKFEMTTDPESVAELCSEVGIDISHIDQGAYTIYVWEDIPSGSLLRYIINE